MTRSMRKPASSSPSSRVETCDGICAHAPQPALLAWTFIEVAVNLPTDRLTVPVPHPTFAGQVSGVDGMRGGVDQHSARCEPLSDVVRQSAVYSGT